MERVILCHGRRADKPLHLETPNLNIFTIEELCYYIYNNIYSIERDFFTNDMAKWLEEQAELPEAGQRLKRLIDRGNKCRDIILCLFRYCDYYTEQDIKNLITIMDEKERLSPLEKAKKRADHLLQYRKFAQAKRYYEEILFSKDIGSLSSEEYGNIVHNIAVIELYTDSFKNAGTRFLEAYKRNGNEKSLWCCLYAYVLGQSEEELIKVVESEGISQEIIENIEKVLEDAKKKAKKTKEWIAVKKVFEEKEKGNINEYYEKLDVMLQSWKKEYRERVK